MNDDEEMRGYTPNLEPAADASWLTYESPTARNMTLVSFGPTPQPLLDLGGMPMYPIVSVNGVNTAICPDLLTIEQIGAADNLRGRVVRAFFRMMEWIPW